MKKEIPALQPVESSNIEAIGHEGDQLFVRFKGGGLYAYSGVPARIGVEMAGAKSPGSYFHANVRSRFAGERVVEEKGEDE